MTTVDILPGTIVMPREDWIPNIDQLTDTAGGLLAVCGRVLDDYSMGETFKRRYWTHGDIVPIVKDDDSPGQVVVVLKNLELGRAGEKQFALDSGALGKYAFIVPQYDIQLWMPWPKLDGGLRPILPADTELMAAGIELNRALVAVFSALRALSLGGIITTPPVLPVAQDHMIVGPISPLGPIGGLAGWSIEVQVQF